MPSGDEVRDVLVNALRSRSRHPWRQADGTGSVTAVVDHDGEPVLRVDVRRHQTELELRVEVAPRAAYDVTEAAGILRAAEETARSTGAGTVVLASGNDVTRHEARGEGYEGPLRGALRLGVGGDPAVRARRAPMTGEALRDAVAALVPDMDIAVRPPARGIRRLSEAAVSGLGPVARLDVRSSRVPPLRVTVPLRDDLMPEPIALAVDTAQAIRSRYPTSLEHVRTVAFGHYGHGMVHGRVAGETAHVADHIAVNAAYCCSDLAATLVERQGDWRPAKPSASTGASSRVEKIVAHELGHQFDFWLQATRYRDGIDMRRVLGLELGVPTLERAVRGGLAGAPADERAAYGLLINGVSPYASASIAEAMAELFAVAWFAGGDAARIVQKFLVLIAPYSRP